jgi:hypothetical protein
MANKFDIGEAHVSIPTGVTLTETDQQELEKINLNIEIKKTLKEIKEHLNEQHPHGSGAFTLQNKKHE